MIDAYEELANAIILQAVKDYRDARRVLARLEAKTTGRQRKDTLVLAAKDPRYVEVLSDKKPKDRRVSKAKDDKDSTKIQRMLDQELLARRRIAECEAFFVSGWFSVLSNVDGEMLLCKLQKEDVR